MDNSLVAAITSALGSDSGWLGISNHSSLSAGIAILGLHIRYLRKHITRQIAEIQEIQQALDSLIQAARDRGWPLDKR